MQDTASDNIEHSYYLQTPNYLPEFGHIAYVPYNEPIYPTIKYPNSFLRDFDILKQIADLREEVEKLTLLLEKSDKIESSKEDKLELLRQVAAELGIDLNDFLTTA